VLCYVVFFTKISSQIITAVLIITAVIINRKKIAPHFFSTDS